MRHRMYPSNPKIYQDIFEAKNAGAIIKIGNPTYDDKSWTNIRPWGGRPIIQFGNNSEDNGNGAQVSIPDGYDTVWVRVLGDRWNVIHAYFKDVADLGNWSAGHRSSNSYSADGTLADGHGIGHEWVPIPVGTLSSNRKLNLISKL